MGKFSIQKTTLIKSITSIALVTSIMIGTTGVISKKADKASSQEDAFYTLTTNTFSASRAQAANERTVTFRGAATATVKVSSGNTLWYAINQAGFSAPKGYTFTYKIGGTTINSNYIITANLTIDVVKTPNSGQVILHNLGSPSGSPRILNLKSGDKLTPYISMKSDYDKKYLLAVYSSVQYGGRTYFHPKYTPALIMDPSAPRQEFTGIWIGRGESKTITYTMTKSDVKSLKSTVEKEIKDLENGQKANRVVAGIIVGAITSFLCTPLAGFIVGVGSTLVDPGDPSTEAAIKEMYRIKALCDTALSQGGSKYAMKVRYDYPSSSGYNACLECDVNCQIISFNRI